MSLINSREHKQGLKDSQYFQIIIFMKLNKHIEEHELYTLLLPSIELEGKHVSHTCTMYKILPAYILLVYHKFSGIEYSSLFTVWKGLLIGS